MSLFVSRDDGESFMPAVFPSTLKQTRYTIMDQVLPPPLAATPLPRRA